MMSIYSIALVIYSMGALIISFEMAYKIAGSSWIQLVFSGLLIAAIYQFHDMLREVILVQVALMAVFFIAVATPFLYNIFKDSQSELGTEKLDPAIGD